MNAKNLQKSEKSRSARARRLVALQRVVDDVKRDARRDPETFLESSRVRAGGE